ncbi:glycosyltransferase, partial [Candidatus Bathyarchaeota archaeon]|nr:glycosyltransferase [Candidatus Bathyarchaeota archaeon]
MISDVDVFIPFYTCEEGKEKHIYLLRRCVESAKREGAERIFVIDCSPTAPLKSGDIDAEVLRNEKHSLACAVNIAIEHCRKDMFVAATGSIFGAGTLKNMVQEKKIAEKEFGKPVALYGLEAGYPTEDQWFLQSPMAGNIETVNKELDDSGFKYTDEGIAIAKEPRTDWKTGSIYYARTLGVGYLANKDRLLEIGGADERCWCIDYDTGMRWISFGWPLLRSESGRMHRVCGTTNRACYRERRLDEIGTFCGY